MAYYSDCNGQMNNHSSVNEYNFQNAPSSSNSYSSGHSFGVPTCHICGIQGHIPMDCQKGLYSFTRWAEKPNMTCRDSSPVISSFSSSYPMQGIGNELGINYQPKMEYSLSTFEAYEQEIFQRYKARDSAKVKAERQAWFEDYMKMRQEQEKMNHPQPAEPELVHQPQEIDPVELNDHPLGQPAAPVLDEDEANSDVKDEDITADQSHALIDIIPQEIATTLHSTTPPIEVELRYTFPILEKLHIDDTLAHDIMPKICHSNHFLYCYSSIIGDSIDDSEGIDPIISSSSSHARIILPDTCPVNAQFSLVKTCNYHNVLYNYNYMIGYSIDDLEGLYPITCSCCFFECTFRLLHVQCQLQQHHIRVDIPWDPGGSMAW